jgi:hypothetical protein
MATATGVIEAAEATRNPYAISFALNAYGNAFRDADPDRAREAMRRGLVIAHDSGNRDIETHLAACLALLETHSGDPLAALEYSAVAIRRLHDSGNNSTTIRGPLAILAALFNRLQHYEPAATIAGFRAQSHDCNRSPSIRHRDHTPTGGPRRPDLRLACPQGPDDDHRRHGHLRLRPIDQARAALNAVLK